MQALHEPLIIILFYLLKNYSQESSYLSSGTALNPEFELFAPGTFHVLSFETILNSPEL